MKYRPLGMTGLHVSTICVGTMNFGTPLDQGHCDKLVRHALDAGVTFFDTANVYEGYARTFGSAGGTGEELLGKALAGRRHEAVVCTKLGNPNGTGPLNAGLSNRHLTVELEKSLQRLRTDYVDVLLAHRTDPSVATCDLWATFDRLVRSGKVLSVGVSNWPSWRLAQACELAQQHGWTRCAVSSPEYSLLSRDAELEHLPACQHYQVGVVSYKGFKGGVLTGKYRRGQTDYSGTRAGDKLYWVPKLEDPLFDKLEAYRGIVERSGLSMTEYTISWLLSRPMVASIILGFRTTEQLDAAVKACEKTISTGDAEEINRIFQPPIRPGGEQVMHWRDGWVLDDLEL